MHALTADSVCGRTSQCDIFMEADMQNMENAQACSCNTNNMTHSLHSYLQCLVHGAVTNIMLLLASTNLRAYAERLASD